MTFEEFEKFIDDNFNLVYMNDHALTLYTSNDDWLEFVYRDSSFGYHHTNNTIQVIRNNLLESLVRTYIHKHMTRFPPTLKGDNIWYVTHNETYHQASIGFASRFFLDMQNKR